MRPQQLAGGDAEVDAGHAELADGGEHGLAVRAARSARSRRATARRPSCRRAGPPTRRAATWERSEVMARSVRRSMSWCHERRIAVHQRLGLEVGARRPALDQVAGDGEGRAGEADQRHVELAHEQAHGLEHERRVGLGVERAQAVRGRRDRSKGCSTTGPTPGCDVDAEADGGDGHDDVGVEDGGVDAVAPHRLEGDLGGQVGVADGVEDAAGAADGPVLGQRPSGLAHEPHRYAAPGRARFARFATAGPQERRVGQAVGGDDRRRFDHVATLEVAATSAQSDHHRRCRGCGTGLGDVTFVASGRSV